MRQIIRSAALPLSARKFKTDIRYGGGLRTRSDMEGRGFFDSGVPKQALKYKIQVTTTPSL